MTDPTTPADRQPAGRWWRGSAAFTVAVTALDIGGAIAGYQFARRAGASDAAAYLIGSVGPICGAAVVWLRSRSASGASIAVLVFTTLSALAVLIGSHDARMLLYKDSVVTALVGLIFAGSLLMPRPLAFYFGQRFFTDGTREAINAWNQLWDDRRFRRANRQVTTVWAVSYLIAAAGKAWLIHLTRIDTAYPATQILPIAAAGIATVLTLAITRRYDP
ncbi:MAG: hypothetical protein JO243_15685 [Solirubrobacterales bacterium]|nr:hypothetical protein [Solirubrobacterales bacterium]